jgi:hypothetical protein
MESFCVEECRYLFRVGGISLSDNDEDEEEEEEEEEV